MGEEIMTIHIELEAERGPGGDTQVTQAKFFVKEIEVIVEALALIKLKECLYGGFIMPGLISIALFHGRKNMYQSLGFTGFENDILDAVIFTEGVEFTSAMR